MRDTDQYVSCLEGRISQLLETAKLGHRKQDPQVDGALNQIDVIGVEIEPFSKRSDEFFRRRGFDLETNDVATAAPADLALDCFKMRAPAFGIQIQLRVARQADHARLEDLLSREKL